jgi:hypothetical protein
MHGWPLRIAGSDVIRSKVVIVSFLESFLEKVLHLLIAALNEPAGQSFSAGPPASRWSAWLIRRTDLNPQ